VSKKAKVLTMSLILTAVLIVSVTGVVFAADGQGVCTQNQGDECLCGECPCEECPCEECPCVDGFSDSLQLKTRTQAEINQQISNDPEKGNSIQKRTQTSRE
jgi:hypothetical protein